MSQGIFGLIDFEKGIDHPDEVFRTMGAFLNGDISKRGEYSSSHGRHYILGMRRICNDAKEQQAEIANNRELGTLCLIHGEIHNYRDLLDEHIPETVQCRGDLDLVIHLSRRLGPHFAKKLNGMFSLALLDHFNSSVILLNDRFGMAHQLYWTVIGGRFCFATHLKTLLSLPWIRRDIDMEALNLFMKYSYIPSPWTIFQGIRKLPPGNILVFKDGKVDINPYWEFGTACSPVVDLQEAVSIYRTLMIRAISRRLGPNGKTGILLSGGLDSSANVAFAAQCVGAKIKTFSVGFDEAVFDERYYARIVATHFNTDHFEYTITGKEIEDLPKLVWHLEEPYFEFGLFLTYLGMAAARKEVETVIGGEGADQLFGTGGFAKGMPVALHYLFTKYRLLRPARRAARLLNSTFFCEKDNPAFKFRILWNRAIDLNNWYFYGYDERELQLLHKDPASASVPRIFPDHGNGRPSSFPDLYNETLINQDLRHYTNENVMVKAGRMADMMNLALRESYLDPEVTDFLISLVYPLKRSGGLFDHLTGRIMTKFLHRKAMENLLPPEIMQKPKQGGFVPVMIFLKNEKMRKNIYRHLLNSEIMREYFRSDYLKTLFANYERMIGKNVYWHNFYNSKANRILFLLTFDIWHHLYMRQNSTGLSLPSLSDYLLSGTGS
jgi:asparagine synthase (glutamine-hydrolysing)